MKTNFKFLIEKYPELAKIGELSERYLYPDPNTCIFKLGQYAETVVNYMMAYENLSVPHFLDDTHSNRIKQLQREELLPQNISDILYRLRKKRNEAVHENFSSLAEAKILLRHAFTLSVWFMQVYVDYSFEPEEYVEPIESLQEIKSLSEENKQLENELTNLKALYEYIKSSYDKDEAIKRKKIAYTKSNQISISEAETRDLIDEQLRQAGWEADTNAIRYSKDSRPEKGRNLAIAEWPTDSHLSGSGKRGRVDYALFIGLKLVGIIEAKKRDQDVSSVIDDQCTDYAKHIKEEHNQYIVCNYDEYKVPFLFAANSRKYLEEIKEKSGIWFLDARKSSNVKKALRSWYSPENILQLIERDLEIANDKLRTDKSDYLKDEDGLNLRDYQVDAVNAVSSAIIDGKKNILVSMATGTGKTRVALGLVYKLIANDRFNRILFLVDRTALGIQAIEKFEEVKIEELQNICEIYDVKKLEDIEFEKDTRIHIATVQSLVKRILYRDENSKYNHLSPGDYDLIIVDEAHRGYILDKEMDEDDIKFKNQDDYRSKYRQVIDYFDSVKIGLTATPALHTTEIFGLPVYTYSYRQAVIDGHLVDHEPPYTFQTKLNTEGIKYEKGDTLVVYDPNTHELINGAELADDVVFNVEKFNRKVIAPDFNETVLKELSKYIDPEGDEKTLIFAVNDNHADMIVNILRDIYSEYGVNNRAIRKITGYSEGGNKKKIEELIKRYKNEVYPNIAVTVDLLTTGIDVPSIANIVFIRRVKSRILFEQMIGRATRLCPEIKKTHFNIFDAVFVYDDLEQFTNMKQVVQSTSEKIEDLINDLPMVSEDNQSVYIDKILAKLHRKKALAAEGDIEQIKHNHDDMDINDIIKDIRTGNIKEKVEKINAYKDTLIFIDSFYKRTKEGIIYSDKKDEMKNIRRGYGDSDKPEDYLEGFKVFIEENKEKIPALSIVLTKPESLTRKELKGLRMELDKHTYSQANLSTAWNKASNADIAADIISIIRTLALGIPIKDHESRIKAAVGEVKKRHDFTKQQLSWLAKIENILITDYVIDMKVFDEGVYKKQGGFKRFNMVFENKLEEIVDEINTELYRA